MKKGLLIYLLFLSVHLAIDAQDITVRAECPSVVQAGQQFSLMWEINSGGGDFSAPSFDGFYKLMGPQTSYSSSTQIINGRISQNTTYSYVYFLQALSPGKFKIAPASYKIKNKTFYSDTLYIEVVGSGAGSATGSGQRNSSQGQVSEEKIDDAGGDIFVNINLSRKEVYVGEYVLASIKLYTKTDISGINDIKYPPFTGFLKTDIETPPLNSLRQENINGTTYGTGVLQEFLLFPQVSGELTIDPAQLTVLVRQRSGGQSDPFFGDFFATYQNVPKAVLSKPVRITVKPLPGTRPSDFSGVVGKLAMRADVDKDSVKVNDAINLKIILTGNGNLKLAQAPKLQASGDIEVYDPKVTDDIKSGPNGISGQRTFEYLLIPRHYGDFVIPPVTYSYFDNSTGKYVQLSTSEFRFHASKAEGQDQGSGITVFGGVNKEDVKYIGKDIRFIKNDAGKLSGRKSLIVTKRTFYSLYAVAFLIFIITLIARREHIKRNADKNAVRNRKAGKVAVKRLKIAAEYLKNNEIDKFHEEILRSLWGYLSDKLNIPLSDLTRSNAVFVLNEKGVNEEITSKLISLLDTCEYARYAPSASGKDAGTIYEDASGFIKSVENSVL